MTQTIEIRKQQFLLHDSGAMYWLQKKMLLIADVHFGKVTHFRKYGAAIPKQASEENFRKLQKLVEEIKPDTICFLGDLFHSTINSEWEPFRNWVENTKASIILVSGNHDIIPTYLFEELKIEVLDTIKIDTFMLTHHPTEDATLFNICGHIHPGIRMKGVGRQIMKLSCFYKTETQLILPAFGNFTGKHILSPKETDDIFVIVDGEVICVSN